MGKKIIVKNSKEIFILFVVFLTILCFYTENVKSFDIQTFPKSNALPCSNICYNSSSIIIQFSNFTSIRGESQIKYSFYNFNQTDYVNITFKLIHSDSNKITLWKYSYLYDRESNLVLFKNGSNFGNLHIFQNPIDLQKSNSKLIFCNYNNQNHEGTIENDNNFQNYYTKDHLCLAYSRVRFYDNFNTPQDLNYEVNSGLLLTQTGEILYFDLFPDFNIISCGGDPYSLDETDYNLETVTPIHGTNNENIDPVNSPHNYGILLLISGISVIFFLTFRTIKKKL
ncbi:MAG: hypothetical protein ACTSWL_03310 [Promethearchaeota archaeon]